MTDQDKITDAHIRRLENLIGLVEDEWGEYDDNLCEELLEHLKNYKAIQETMTDCQKQQTRDRIGLRIMALRKLAGLTQEQLSERAGLQRSHVAKIERGKYAVTFETIQAIAEALGMTVDIIDPRLSGLAQLRTLSEPMIGSLGESLNKKVTKIFTVKESE